LTLVALDAIGNACNKKKTISKSFEGKSFEGTIPSCIFNLQTLSTLTVSGNQISGTIPEISLSSNLSVLSLAANRLTGSIPNSIQQYGKFKSIDFSNNRLYGNLSNFKVYDTTLSLSLQVNRLSGTIPKDVNGAQYINIFDGNHTKFTLESQYYYLLTYLLRKLIPLLFCCRD
jgi:Leucine-rich repeat (LRR) protein